MAAPNVRAAVLVALLLVTTLVAAAAAPLSVRLTTGSTEQSILVRPSRAHAPSKVKVAFYTESLCPDCRNFTLGALATAFDDGVADIMDVELVPFGNARREPDTGELICQHGPLECTFNKVFGCATHLYPAQAQWFPFLRCMEQAKPLMMRAALAECAMQASMSAGDINGCVEGSLGEQLEASFEKATDALVPAHTFVPWVTVNGVALREDVDNLEQYVCAAYTGDRPAACFGSKVAHAPAALAGCPASKASHS
eukprot:jgi/Tetstr1/454700/TSEL_041586.t1